MIKMCSKCNKEVRLPGSSYCRLCYNEYRRDRYLREKTELEAYELAARLDEEAAVVRAQLAAMDEDPHYRRPPD